MNTKPKPKDDRLAASGVNLVRTSDDELTIWHDKRPELKVKINASRLEGWVKRQLRGGMFA